MTARGGDRRAIWGWCLYDFANSAYTTLVVTFIYGIYFKNQIAADTITGTALWTRGITITAIVVAVTSPFLGAIADRGGMRRRFLVWSTVFTVFTVSLLYLPGPGQVALALTLFVMSNISYELSGVFYNSYLPDISPPEKIGRISGYGWALGYVGGLLAMAIALFVFIRVEVPPFGLDVATGENVRVSNLLVGVWFAVFSIPMFLWVKEPPRSDAPSAGQLVREAASQLGATFREIRDRYTDIFRLLVARMVYNDGLVTIFALGPLFVQEVFQMTMTEVLQWGIFVNVTAGLGAFAMGFLDDRVGGKKTLFVTLIGLTIGGVWAVTAADTGSIYLAGLWIGIFVGPNQAASRSLLGRFVPEVKETEFYGFFAFSGKAIAFLGPLMYGELTRITGNPRLGMASIILFFLIGGLILTTVDERRGAERALEPA